MKQQCTFRKTSDTGPSFSEATSSCLTFSNPLIIACISSAKDFNCICKDTRLQTKHSVTKLQTSNAKRLMETLVAASRLTNSRWKSKRAGVLAARTWATIKHSWDSIQIDSSCLHQKQVSSSNVTYKLGVKHNSGKSYKKQNDLNNTTQKKKISYQTLQR